MYHRVAALETDIWRLAVSPTHFEEHLQILSRNWRVIPLSELAEDLKNKKLKKNSVAITFDDGYADNYLAAKPLLEKYQLPATFFVTSATIGQQVEFWWDELENIILQTEELPKNLKLEMGSTMLAYDLGPESRLTTALQQRQNQWKAYVNEPPTLRCELYLKIWQALRPLAQYEQQKCLQYLRNWAGIDQPKVRRSYLSMGLEQLQCLSQSRYCEIGAHTVSHPDLTGLSLQAQTKEIRDNRHFLEKATGRKVTLFAYPYGRYNNDTFSVVVSENIAAAVTTNGDLVKPTSHSMLLGRFLVDNWTGQEFEGFLKTWLK
ncbi:Polysaccharide deacetylase [Pontibacter indicus]|uniref:Polysaccharide deacetylase n=2 Tax=Pontibacter indicus TaxID=1317125 RepID=A0A1R3XP65_9BACT|nr:Polysaccharide deacetylase [Pontibacter indicus]